MDGVLVVITSIILDLIKREQTHDEIIEGIVQNFSLDKSIAQKKFAEVLSSAEVVQTLYKKKQIKIKKNPGFLTIIKLDKLTGEIFLQVSGIDNIYYYLL